MNMVNAILILVTCVVAYPVAVVTAGEPVITGQAPVGDTAEKASPGGLDFLLQGTVLHDSGEMMAIIQVGQTGDQELYWLGDTIEGGRLTNILHDRVTLTFAETEVELLLSGGARGAQAEPAMVTARVQPRLIQIDGGFWRVDRETLDQLSRNQELITDVTSLGDGGVQVDKVQADGLFHTLGLQQDDIIRNINGQVPGADRSLQQEIEKTALGETMLRLEIERQGHTDVVYFEIDP